MADLSCKDCHEPQRELRVGSKVCLDCHAGSYLEKMSELQKTYAERLAVVKDAYNLINKYAASAQGGGEIFINLYDFKCAEYNYKYALLDHSQGIHNSEFVRQLLYVAEKTLSKLSEYYNERVRILVQEGLQADDLAVRLKALQVLGGIGDERALDTLLQALQDSQAGVREEAVKALSLVDNVRTVPALMSALKDESCDVRLWAFRALERRKALPLDGQIQKLQGDLQGPDPDARERAAKTLGETVDARCVWPLIQALKDVHEGVRREAVRALANTGDARAVKPLIQALQDPDAEVRKGAKIALEKLKALPVGSAGIKPLLN